MSPDQPGRLPGADRDVGKQRTGARVDLRRADAGDCELVAKARISGDGDGAWDGDERDAHTDPADADSRP